MKNRIIILTMMMFMAVFCQAQESNKQLGYYMDDEVPNGIPIYLSSNSNLPIFDHYKLWNGEYHFMKTKEVSITTGPADQHGIWYQIAITTGSGISYGTPWTNNGQSIGQIDVNTYLFVKKEVFDSTEYGYFNHIPISFILTGLTIPFKYHPPISGYSSSLFNSNFNVGSVIGVQLQNNAQTFGVTFGGFLGVSDISQTSSVNTQVTGATSQSMFAFNYGGAVLFQVPKNIQLGLVIGVDNGIGSLGNSYIYQNKVWFAFSLNYNFIGGL